MLPNLFVIGAPKCGTTSLHYYLDQHPEVSMSRVKEPHVFSSPDWQARLALYQGQFELEARWRGEASTSYSTYPMEGDVAARMRAAVSDPRFLYLVCDPVERAVGQYVQALFGRRENRPVEVALGDFENPRNWYVCASRYSMQVERYLQHFPPSALMVVDRDDLRERRGDTLAEVFRFLGVDASFTSPKFGHELGRSDERLDLGGLGRRLRASGVPRALRRLPPSVRHAIKRAVVGARVGKVLERPELPPDLESALRDFLRGDVERLRALTGKPFDRWSI